MNIICINNLLPSDFQPFFGERESSRAVTIASELLPREPIRMLKGHFSMTRNPGHNLF
jgi:hypothetical protein